MAGLFLHNLFQQQAGVVSLEVPVQGQGYKIIEGFLTEDPSISLGNQWKSAIEDISSINDFTMLLGGSATSWLSTSKAGWTGTSPIKMDLNFYLLTFLKEQANGTGRGIKVPISKAASYLAALCSVSGDSAYDDRPSGGLSIGVHGGYKPDYFIRNQDFTGFEQKGGSGDPSSISGTVSIAINGGGKPSVTLTKMLLDNINFTPSSVRAGYWEGDTFVQSAEPLYIQVQASFRMCQTPLNSDAARIFTGSSSL